ncbi:MFS transporter [Streptomyces platensis]|uniref:MFS transporter n=1 Tax=Streptomyces platensis TaxID=58346 RepID=UPI002E276784|nr:MFS transporter [Streptomyces platensis]WUB77739.1 MFS transporter [Streptomyces platensis]WUB84582.1 MFS transporter [Streptomyces platensis]
MIASLVDSVGTGMYVAGGIIYFTRSLGLSATQVGTGISLGALIAALCVVGVGRVADRIGIGRALVALQVWSALAFLCFLLVDGFAAFALVACLVAVPERGWHPLASTVVSAVVEKEQRTDALAVMRMLRNTGFAVGGLLAMGTLSVASNGTLVTVMLVNSLSFGGSALLLSALGVAGPKVSEAVARLRTTDMKSDRVPWRVRLPYVKVAALDAVCCLHMSLLSIGFPLSITLWTDLPTWVVGGTYVVNTIFAISFQRRVSAGLKASVRTATVVMGVTLSLLAATCAAIALLPELPVAWGLICLAVGVLILTAAELSQAAASWTLLLGLAPRDASAEIYATFELGFSAQLVFGPLLVSMLVDHGGNAWLVLACSLLALIPFVAPVVKSAERRRLVELAPSP